MSYIDPPYPARLDCAIKLPIDYQGGLMFTRDKQLPGLYRKEGATGSGSLWRIV